MNIAEIINWGKYKLKSVSSTPLLDIQVILEHFLGYTKSQLIIKEKTEISQAFLAKIKLAIKKRQNYWPVAYITGHKEFYARQFKVNKHTLIPRPETEELVEYALSIIKNQHLKTVLDLGTGSGCIAITCQQEIPNLQVWASDISGSALKIAKANAQQWRAKINWQISDLLSNFKEDQNWNIIIANLPYVRNDHKELSIKHEPISALFSGVDGLDHYRLLAQQINKPRCKHLIIEIDDAHAESLKNIFTSASQINIIKDLNGKRRIGHIIYLFSSSCK